MGRMKRVLSASAVVALATAASSSSALAQAHAAARTTEVRTVTAVIGGVIKGIVSDERGGPLPGAMVSALGATMAMAVTDANGRFSIEKLPAGSRISIIPACGSREPPSLGAAATGCRRCTES